MTHRVLDDHTLAAMAAVLERSPAVADLSQAAGRIVDLGVLSTASLV
jgi:hypothetical protein